LNSAFSVIDSRIDNSNQNGLGFSANANYNRRIGDWITNGSFSYGQNVSTLLITYMTSYYSYSGVCGAAGATSISMREQVSAIVADQ
jgi:hypothetical protein